MCAILAPRLPATSRAVRRTTDMVVLSMSLARNRTAHALSVGDLSTGEDVHGDGGSNDWTELSRRSCDCTKLRQESQIEATSFIDPSKPCPLAVLERVAQ